MDFEEHLAARRSALSAADAAEESRLAEMARVEERAAAAMQRMTAEFARRADAIGFLPRTVVELRSGEWGKSFFRGSSAKGGL